MGGESDALAFAPEAHPPSEDRRGSRIKPSTVNGPQPTAGLTPSAGANRIGAL
jgi:hypothetical protein